MVCSQPLPLLLPLKCLQHNVKRVRYSAEAVAAKKEREKARLKEFQTLTGEVLPRVRSDRAGPSPQGLYTLSPRSEAEQRVLQGGLRPYHPSPPGQPRVLHNLELSSQHPRPWHLPLEVCPDVPYVFAPRRNTCLCLRSTPAQINDVLSDDLSLTTTFLKQHPKVYWIWNHRQWCLAQVPDGPTSSDPHAWRQSYWNKELFVVEKMLDADPRNCWCPRLSTYARPDLYSAVLAWNYRRHVLAEMPVKRSETSELAYTQRKIESNISNFSAWHQRSKVLTSLWDAGKLDKVKAIKEGACLICVVSNSLLIRQFRVEFDLVRNAMYTDPNDQSVWIYHRWLVGPGKSCD